MAIILTNSYADYGKSAPMIFGAEGKRFIHNAEHPKKESKEKIAEMRKAAQILWKI